MPPRRNPFEYGRELTPQELVDREEELARIQATVRNRGKLFLIGPRRFGKTSLLRAAGQGAREEGVMVLRFDAEKYETLEVLARAVLTRGAQALKSPVERVMEILGSAAASLRPRLELGPDGSLAVGIGVESRDHGEVPLLTDALDAVEALAARTEQEVTVILDEVQHILLEHGEAAERQLRATIQRHAHVSYLLAGSATRFLTAMTEDPNRPFYRLGERLFLEEVPREAFLQFLREAFAVSGFSVAAGGCQAVLELAEEVPYNVQRLAHELWEMLRAGTIDRVDREAAIQALRRVTRREDPAYTQIWSVLTRNQKKALKAVLTSEGTGLQSGDTARAFAISPSSMQAALNTLEERSLLRRESRKGEVRYCLVDPFLGAWLEDVQAV
jgi:hypothetical protein